MDAASSELYTITSSHYRLDWFQIFILMSGIIAFIYIVIATVYFANLTYLLPPNVTEAQFLFISGIIIALWFAVLVILAGLRIAKPVNVVYHHDALKNVEKVSYPVEINKSPTQAEIKEPKMVLPIGTHVLGQSCVYTNEGLPRHYYGSNTFV